MFDYYRNFLEAITTLPFYFNIFGRRALARDRNDFFPFAGESNEAFAEVKNCPYKILASC